MNIKEMVKKILPQCVNDSMHIRRRNIAFANAGVLPQQAELLLPQATLFKLFPGIDHVSLEVSPHQFYRPTTMVLPLAENLTIAAICKHVNPKTIFEIGTYTGVSTLLMAQNSSENTKIWTLDLDEDTIEKLPIDYVPGEAFKNSKVASRITQLHGDSREFDFSPYYGKIDLVFVDANHSYPFVKSDTEVAFKLLAPNGIIIWDDYDWGEYPDCAGVAGYLNELKNQKKIWHLENTRLAIFVN